MTYVMIPALRRELDEGDESFRAGVARQLGVDPGDVGEVRVLRQAVDARRKGDVFFSVHAAVALSPRAARRVLGDKKRHAQVYAEPEPLRPVHGKEPAAGRIVVVGMGPGGLFAAWLLAREGYEPLLIDRGRDMDRRVRDVEHYWLTGRADLESNPLFGEGGAGTFSDGKLTARSKDPRCATVLDAFLACGAPQEIGVLAKPHVGTDRLRQVVKGLRNEIVALGGEVCFATKLDKIHMADGRLKAVTLVREGAAERIDCAALVLAIGQGARDTYRYLHDSGFAMAPKPFAVGVRAEHPQKLIDESQYGPFAGHPKLGAADYKLTCQAAGRGVYSFCMCPGGFVVASGAGPGEMVVNGMNEGKMPASIHFVNLSWPQSSCLFSDDISEILDKKKVDDFARLKVNLRNIQNSSLWLSKYVREPHTNEEICKAIDWEIARHIGYLMNIHYMQNNNFSFPSQNELDFYIREKHLKNYLAGMFMSYHGDDKDKDGRCQILRMKMVNHYLDIYYDDRRERRNVILYKL